MLGVRKFEREDIPFRSKFGNILTRKILFLATRQNLSDTQTGLRAFDQSLIDEMLEIRGERYEYELNVLLYAIEKQIEIVETPIKTIYEDSNSSSHFNPLRDSLKIYKEILKFASSSIISFVVDFEFFCDFGGVHAKLGCGDERDFCGDFCKNYQRDAQFQSQQAFCVQKWWKNCTKTPRATLDWLARLCSEISSC